VTISFESLAAEIREKAQSLQLANPAGRVFTDEAWQSLDVIAPNFSGLSNFSPRGNLLLLKGDDAIRAVYRMVLKRDADAGGLASYREQVEKGMPIFLVAGILGISDEARRLGRAMPDFWAYRWLARLLRVASRSHLDRYLGITRRVFRFAQELTERTRRDDIGKTRLDRVDPLCEVMLAWHPMLVRKAGQLEATQLRLSHLEKSIEAAQAELASVLRRMIAASSHAEAQSQAQSPLKYTAQPSVAVANIAHAFKDTSNEPACSEQELDQYYLAFEDHLRGGEQAMREKLLAYQPELDRLKTSVAELPILDLGCGRGEWLEFVAGLGFPGKGIDQNPVMVKASVDKGLNVTQADLISALKAQPEQSLSAVTAFQVAEHLSFDVLFTCVKESWRVLAEGGMLLLETPNPENLMVASHTFYHDHTHRNPLTPAAMTFLLQYWGFKHVTIKRLNPYPESARVAGEGLLADRFNGHFCGPQDFAVIGYK
jgi:SAM-dependent methyltransferase